MSKYIPQIDTNVETWGAALERVNALLDALDTVTITAGIDENSNSYETGSDVNRLTARLYGSFRTNNFYVVESIKGDSGTLLIDSNEHITGTSQIDGDFQADGNATVKGNLTVQKDLRVNVNAKIDGNFQADGSATVGGNLSVNGSEIAINNGIRQTHIISMVNPDEPFYTVPNTFSGKLIVRISKGSARQTSEVLFDGSSVTTYGTVNNTGSESSPLGVVSVFESNNNIIFTISKTSETGLLVRTFATLFI